MLPLLDLTMDREVIRHMSGKRRPQSNPRIAGAPLRWPLAFVFLVAALLALGAGCGTLENGRG